MTCVVALRHDGVIYMGCDSAGVGGYSRSNRLDPKIYRVGEMLIGFTTSFRMGQLLGYSLTLPRPTWRRPSSTPCAIASRPAAGRRKTRTWSAAAISSSPTRAASSRSKGDYQVAENAEPYNAVGCGFDLALGSLFTSGRVANASARERVEEALQAAAAFSAGVYPPFRIEELGALAAQQPPPPPPPPEGRVVRDGVVPS